MTYERQTFTDFDESNPLCAKHLNHIEDGIVALEEALGDGVTPSVSFRYDETTGALYYEVSDAEVLDEAVF